MTWLVKLSRDFTDEERWRRAGAIATGLVVGGITLVALLLAVLRALSASGSLAGFWLLGLVQFALTLGGLVAAAWLVVATVHVGQILVQEVRAQNIQLRPARTVQGYCIGGMLAFGALAMAVFSGWLGGDSVFAEAMRHGQRGPVSLYGAQGRVLINETAYAGWAAELPAGRYYKVTFSGSMVFTRAQYEIDRGPPERMGSFLSLPFVNDSQAVYVAAESRPRRIRITSGDGSVGGKVTVAELKPGGVLWLLKLTGGAVLLSALAIGAAVVVRQTRPELFEKLKEKVPRLLVPEGHAEWKTWKMNELDVRDRESEVREKEVHVEDLEAEKAAKRQKAQEAERQARSGGEEQYHEELKGSYPEWLEIVRKEVSRKEVSEQLQGCMKIAYEQRGTGFDRFGKEDLAVVTAKLRRRVRTYVKRCRDLEENLRDYAEALAGALLTEDKLLVRDVKEILRIEEL